MISAESADIELLQAEADVFEDFTLFCSLLDIRTKTEGIRRFHHSEWWQEQKELEANRTGADLVLKARQTGISTIELARDLWFAIVNEGVEVLIVTHDRDLKEQLYLAVRIMADGLKALGLLPATRYSTKTELVFRSTGSAVRIVEAGETERAASKKGRSGFIHRLHITELAFWGAATETMTSVMSSVTSNAEITIESTPFGAGGLFYEYVQGALGGRGRYRLHFFPWYRHSEYRVTPRPGFDPTSRDKWETKLRASGCDDAQIQWWRDKVEAIGVDGALQEFPIDAATCFRASGRLFIEPAALDAIADRVRAPARKAELRFHGRLLGEASIYCEPMKGTDYVIGADISEGTGEDAHSAHVLDRRSGETMAAWWSDSLEPGDFGLGLAILGRLYNNALIAPERNNHGHTTIRSLKAEARYPRVYTHDDHKLGWLTSSATRPVLWDDLSFAIREKSTFTPDAATLAECRTVIRDKTGKPVALNKGQKGGCKDDRYVSWAIAWQIRCKSAWTPGSVHIRDL